MGIYRNENVKSLPEQVQENKKNIKQINEILENIDPDQVATILSDISALKAEQVVQNTAIGANQTAIGNNTTAINNEKTAREALIDLDASGNTQVKSATGKTAGVASDTASFVDSADSGIAVANTGITLTTDKEDDAHQVKFDNSGNFQVSNGHVLEFDNTGAITIDGRPIGGGGGVQLYQHNIKIYFKDTSNGHISITTTFISQSATPLASLIDLYNYLYNNNFTNIQQILSASGFYNFMTATTLRSIYGLVALSGQVNIVYFKEPITTSTIEDWNAIYSGCSVFDNVITL